jgi:hypothetical protein
VLYTIIRILQNRLLPHLKFVKSTEEDKSHFPHVSTDSGMHITNKNDDKCDAIQMFQLFSQCQKQKLFPSLTNKFKDFYFGILHPVGHTLSTTTFNYI